MGNSRQTATGVVKTQAGEPVAHTRIDPRALLHYAAIGATDQEIAQKWGVEMQYLQNLRQELRHGVLT